MRTVKASEIQKNFGLWHDRAHDGPIGVSRYGRTTAYLVSAEQFDEMWACYRRAITADMLSNEDMALIRSATVETEQPFSLDDIDEDGRLDTKSRPGTTR
jgi:hypothetical protein